ncbi:MAG: putative quinol monooxygenase [Rehaibacterium terrae]|uniref:putative quinol monooxygenase n=2 Tax=Rehaibacterium terrae TaxID=1341696 RepID=UPI00391A0870
MRLDRRDFLRLAGTALAAAAAGCGFPHHEEPPRMYGLIGKIKATPGQRDALAAILLEGTADMPGCLSYVIAHDPGDPDALWITEVWDSREHHTASLALPAVQQAIARGRPLIAGFGERFETQPLGGHGLGIG